MNRTNSMVTPSSPRHPSSSSSSPSILFVFLVVWLFSNEGFHKLLR